MNVNVPWRWLTISADLEYRETGSDKPDNTDFWSRDHIVGIRQRKAMGHYSALRSRVLGPVGWAFGADYPLSGGVYVVTGDEAGPEESSTSWLLQTQTLEHYTKWRKTNFNQVGTASTSGRWGVGTIREQAEYRETDSDEPNNTQFWCREQVTINRWINSYTGFDLAIGGNILGPGLTIGGQNVVVPGASFIIAGERYSLGLVDGSMYRRDQTLVRYSKWQKTNFGQDTYP